MDNLEKAKNPLSKEKILLVIIGILLVILIVCFAYIKVQQSFSWGKESNDTEEIVETGISAIKTEEIDRQDSKEILPGASQVTKTNQVLNSNLDIADNSAIPGSAQAPKSVLIDQKDLPKEALNLKIKDSKITPNSFTVKSGDLISLAVSSEDEKVHIFSFYNGDMGAISMGISAGRTKAINFNAPAPGEYEFGCGVPQHRANGEKGIMIVK